jgi:hypothetical protein
VLGIVGLEHLHHARGQIPLRHQLDAQRIVGAVRKSLRLANTDICRDSLAAAAYGE